MWQPTGSARHLFACGDVEDRLAVARVEHLDILVDRDQAAGAGARGSERQQAGVPARPSPWG